MAATHPTERFHPMRTTMFTTAAVTAALVATALGGAAASSASTPSSIRWGATPAATPAAPSSTWLTGSIYLSSGSSSHMGVVSVWRAPLHYDIVLEPGHSSSSFRADVDGYFIGTGVNADVWQCYAAYQCDSQTWAYKGNVGPGFHSIPSGRATIMIRTNSGSGSWKAPDNSAVTR